MFASVNALTNGPWNAPRTRPRCKADMVARLFGVAYHPGRRNWFHRSERPTLETAPNGSKWPDFDKSPMSRWINLIFWLAPGLGSLRCWRWSPRHMQRSSWQVRDVTIGLGLTAPRYPQPMAHVEHPQGGNTLLFLMHIKLLILKYKMWMAGAAGQKSNFFYASEIK